jgi:hypothetical protein
MDVKFLVSQRFLEDIEKEYNQKEYKTVNKDKWHAFREVFGSENLSFVLAGDLLRASEKKTQIPAYSFKENLEPYLSGEGIESNIFIISSYSTNGNNFVSREKLEKIVQTLERNQKEGKIKKIINSSKGTLSEDKISIFELPSLGINIPKTFYFEDPLKLSEFVKKTEKEYVLKHRLGGMGVGIYKINQKNIDKVPKINISEYIVQERLDILNEKRIILFNNEYIGSRVIYDRTLPWDKQDIKRKHLTQRYIPSQREIEDTQKIMEHFDAIWGCIDWIETKEKGRAYLEYNGVATGLGMGTPFPYNLNKEVAKRVKNQFL